MDKLMGYCKKDVTPLLTHWSYVFIALNHRLDGRMIVVWSAYGIGWFRIVLDSHPGLWQLKTTEIVSGYQMPCITICIMPLYNCRADSRFASSQWETSLQSNAVSHWTGANLESALNWYAIIQPSCATWIYYRRHLAVHMCKQWNPMSLH